VNVWLALAHRIHPHHRVAQEWATKVDRAESFYLCRITQLGTLRLLTTSSAMGKDVLTQGAAWVAFDRLAEYWDAVLMEEPVGFESSFRRATMRDEASPKHWADAYLATFAQGYELSLVTFDKVLAKRTRGSILLQG
jgi:toxin-antitoxin system PIN domain toxin